MGKAIIVGAAVLAVLAIVAGQHWLGSEEPKGFTSGNGRIEAVELDLATKYAGRLAELKVVEGDFVEAGQELALMDTDNVRARLRQAEARLRQSRDHQVSSQAQVAQAESQLEWRNQQLQRYRTLHQRGVVPQAQLDEALAAQKVASAALDAAKAQAVAALSAIDEAAAALDALQVELQEASLLAPRAGRVQYRLANVGEVLPAGGRVLTLLDLTDVSMSIFLPQTVAGRVALGAEARILLDALPGRAIPAEVSFVAGEAQFTPKQVETRNERDKLMFRVKVRLPVALLEQHLEQVKTGLPGEAWIRLAADQPWPSRLESDLTL
ncbi:HlyD family secretion protein [Zobellella sp. DQSA1]|uniref:HlyD family secretion protein n=1 Tax=Zobellella sp. DQSA1 TaxID=3342386 RepID=UPI0035C0DF70